MSTNNQYDVIIIGTGAGGGTLAYKLAPSGKRILLLERGDYVPREKDNWSTRAVNLDGKYNTKETWYDAGAHYLLWFDVSSRCDRLCCARLAWS